MKNLDRKALFIQSNVFNLILLSSLVLVTSCDTIDLGIEPTTSTVRIDKTPSAIAGEGSQGDCSNVPLEGDNEATDVSLSKPWSISISSLTGRIYILEKWLPSCVQNNKQK